MNRLLRDYQRSQPPPPSDIPTTVKLGMYINSFYEVSAENMEYRISFYIRQSWRDPRLEFSAKSSDGNLTSIHATLWVDDIWTPDLFFRNEKEATTVNILAPQKLLKLNATGHLWYVVKYTATLSCPMKLNKFPFDVQKCPLMFESFGYTADVMQYDWLGSPVDVDPSVQLPEFTMKDAQLENCTQQYTGGAFTCLEIAFELHRDVGYYVMVVFIPSIVIVAMSWVQFWLEPGAVTGRVLVGLFCSFTLVAQMTGLRASLPKVSYVTSLDVWMLVCLLFTASTLIQLALVQIFGRKQGEEVQGKGEEGKSKTSKIDFISRIVFPALFALFSLIYFSVNAA